MFLVQEIRAGDTWSPRVRSIGHDDPTSGRAPIRGIDPDPRTSVSRRTMNLAEVTIDRPVDDGAVGIDDSCTPGLTRP